MSLITIEQLLESVDLDFEPRYITKDSNGVVHIWNTTKLRKDMSNGHYPPRWNFTGSAVAATFTHLKLAEFEGKDWTECIYEVPRKVETTGKIEKLKIHETSSGGNDMVLHIQKTPATPYEMHHKINELVDAVNELKGAKNE